MGRNNKWVRKPQFKIKIELLFYLSLRIFVMALNCDLYAFFEIKRKGRVRYVMLQID